MSEQPLSHSDLVNLINEIIQGQDLTTMTGKIVRQQVFERLGSNAPKNSEQLKNSIRNALTEVLQQQKQSSHPNANSSSPSIGATKPTDTNNNHGNENKPQPDDGDKKEGDSSSPIEQPRKRLHRNASNNDDKKGDEESDFDPDAIEMPQEGNSKKTKGKRCNSENDNESGSDFDIDMDNDSDQIQETEKRRKRKAENEKRVSNDIKKRKSSSSSKSTGGSKSENQLAKLRQICRDLGQPVPPSRLKNKSTVDKCASIVQFLVSKGIDKANPASLTRKEIARHRARLEKEKELEGLDTSNIIEGSRRSGRNRKAPVTPQEDPLPSDLSGPDLSSPNESEGEEYAALSADSGEGA